MTRPVVQSLARHFLTALGGLAVAQGVMSESDAAEMAGALSIAIGVAWSFYDKWHAAQTLQATVDSISSPEPTKPPGDES